MLLALLLRVFSPVPPTGKLLLHQYRHQQNALLRKIVDRIRNSLELKVVLQTAVDQIASLLELDGCVFFWYFKDTQRVQISCERIFSHQRVSQLGYHPLASFGEAAAAIAQGKAIVHHSPATATAWVKPVMQWLTQRHKSQPQATYPVLGADASLLIPVRGQEGSTGYIACLSDKPRHWSAAEADFMESFAQQLEIAICQAQLYEQTQRQAQREQLVNQITRQTRQSFDLETILTQAIAQLLEALKADRCLVHLVEDWANPDISDYPSCPIEMPNGEAFRRRHLYETCRPPFPPSITDFDTHGPITQWVIQHRQPVVIMDVAQDKRVGPHNEEYQRAEIQSSLVVPVQANGTLQAILYLNQCAHKRYWSENDQKLAQAVADQLAISIQQANLYAKTQQQALESAAQAKHLAKTLRELQLTQAQLIQSEKMSSLGRMVAGVAHEINNPVGFIYGNIPYIERYIYELIRILEAYQTHYPEPVPDLQHLVEEVELGFLTKDLSRILASMKSGASRIREIVLSLRNFSRLDESHRKTVDVHDGLESTLFILQSQLGNIQVKRLYGNLPPLECYPRQLNQVFMNVLMNAVEALRHSPVDPKQIVIRTEMVESDRPGKFLARIAIADNGPGIATDIQSKIFDPFFTTKAVGQGTGLGLTVSYQTIVNQHKGQLRCHSEVGQGTEFVIEIPAKVQSARIQTSDLSLPPTLLSQLPPIPTEAIATATQVEI